MTSLQLGRAESQSSVPDLVTVRVPTGSKVVIVSDLHLRAGTSAVTSRVEQVLVGRLRRLSGPTTVVLAGDIVELLGEPGLRPAAAYAAHPELATVIRRISATESCSVVQLVGNHDGDLAWDDAAAEEVRTATGALVALAADLVFDCGGVHRKVRVEHGNRFDPYNAFQDVRNPLDSPLGHHVVREILPIVGQVGRGWLDGAIDLADPPDFPSFVGSRLAYRQLAGHLRWLVIPLLLLLILLRVPLVLLITNHLPEGLQDWLRGLAVVGAALIVDVLFLVFLIGVLLRRSWQALRTLDLSGRGWGQNESARAEAARLVDAGYAGFVCGHSHRPELTSVARDDADTFAAEGFFANSGSGTPVVEAVPGRFGMPPVYVRYLQVSWLEIGCVPQLEVHLYVGAIPLPGATRLERLVAKRPGRFSREPVRVAAWPGGRWP